MWSLFIHYNKPTMLLLYFLYVLKNPWFAHNKLNVLSETSLALNNVIYNYMVLLLLVYCLFLRFNSVIYSFSILVCFQFVKKYIIITSNYQVFVPVHNITSTLLVGLLNVHPAFFYIGSFSLVTIIFNCIRVVYKYKFYQFLNVLSLLPIVTGSYWNYSRTNFSTWWTWDPIELVLVLFILIWLIYLHSNHHSFNSSKKVIAVLLLLLSSVLITYAIRKSLLSSQHSFFNPSISANQLEIQRIIQTSALSFTLLFVLSVVISCSYMYTVYITITSLKIKSFIFNFYNLATHTNSVYIIIIASLSILLINITFYVESSLEFFSYISFNFFFISIYLRRIYQPVLKSSILYNTVGNNLPFKQLSIINSNFTAHIYISLLILILFYISCMVVVKKTSIFLQISNIRELILDLQREFCVNLDYNYINKGAPCSNSILFYFYNIDKKFNISKPVLMEIKDSERVYNYLLDNQIKLHNNSYFIVFDLVYGSTDIVLSKSDYFTSLGYTSNKVVETAMTTRNYFNFDIYSTYFDLWLNSDYTDNDYSSDFYYSLNKDLLITFDNDDKSINTSSFIKNQKFYKYDYLHYSNETNLLNNNNLNKKKGVSTYSALYEYSEYFILIVLALLITIMFINSLLF